MQTSIVTVTLTPPAWKFKLSVNNVDLVNIFKKFLILILVPKIILSIYFQQSSPFIAFPLVALLPVQ